MTYNGDKRRESRKRWRNEHAEQRRAYNKQYRLEHKEQAKVAHRKAYLKNRVLIPKEEQQKRGPKPKLKMPSAEQQARPSPAKADIRKPVRDAPVAPPKAISPRLSEPIGHGQLQKLLDAWNQTTVGSQESMEYLHQIWLLEAVAKGL